MIPGGGGSGGGAPSESITIVGGLTAPMLMLACGLTAPVGVVVPEAEPPAIPEGVITPEALRDASAAWAWTLLTHFSL